jgi:hypothetical protein
MKRSTALVLFTFFDIFALAIAYLFLFQPLSIVFEAIANRVELIKFATNFYMGFGSAVIPIIHIVGLIEIYLPRFFNRTICTRLIYCSVIVSLLLGIGTATMVERAILHHGYTHCEGAAIHRKLLRIEAYVLDEDTCRQLTLERKQRKFLGMR